MKKLAISLILTVLGTLALEAVPAYRGSVKYTQPDGSVITIFRHGDEFGHWVTDAQGHVLIQEEDGFYRVAKDVSPQDIAAAARIRRQAMASLAKAPASDIAIGQKHFLVILVEFKDRAYSMEDPKTFYYNMLNEPGYSGSGGTGSARDFYYDNSHGMFDPIFDVYGPFTLPKNVSYYGKNTSNGGDAHPEEALIDGCKGLDPDIDFSEYDHDGDGFVDLVFMYYAGYGEADSSYTNTIWPHQGEISYTGKTLTLDGVRLESYACANELQGYGAYQDQAGGIGTCCHEFAHALGMPDFYDTDYSANGMAAGLYNFSPMCDGCYNNEGRTPSNFSAYERYIFGWIDEDDIKVIDSLGPVTIPSVDNNIAYKTLTDKDGEFFVYECRVKEGWDSHLDGFGLVVYHVDRSDNVVGSGYYSLTARDMWRLWRSYNNVNAYGTHPCYYVVPAPDQKNFKYGMFAYGGYYYYDQSYGPLIPFPGTKKITSFTPVSWSGTESNLSLGNISFDSGKVSFDVRATRIMLDYACISNPGNGRYSDGDNFDLALEECELNPVAKAEWYLDGEKRSGKSVKLKKGPHIVEAVVSTVSGESYTVKLELEVSD